MRGLRDGLARLDCEKGAFQAGDRAYCDGVSTPDLGYPDSMSRDWSKTARPLVSNAAVWYSPPSSANSSAASDCPPSPSPAVPPPSTSASASSESAPATRPSAQIGRAHV